MTGVEHEQALLGALLLDNSRIGEVSIEPDDFEWDAHRQIYRTISTYARNGMKADPHTLRHAFHSRRRQFPRHDPARYLADLALNAMTRAQLYRTPLRLYADAITERRRFVIKYLPPPPTDLDEPSPPGLEEMCAQWLRLTEAQDRQRRLRGR